MVYGYTLVLIAPPILQACEVDPEIIAQVQSVSADLIYLITGLPIIFFGFRIWAQSMKKAWEERTIAHFATAGWNTYAMAHNVINFSRNAPSAFGRVVDALFGDGEKGFGGRKSRSSKKGKELLIYLVIIIVVLAILGGFFTADAIRKRADAEYDMFEDMNLGQRAAADAASN